ncbi:MAG: bifunctional folylpolyglutamate synthase/dihydrofolate synthase [Mariprofundus sp.]|nr:bifunctional folylpolyglutamate synthase/dihydrofolate synthase [Mariprofundus sp.]
MGNKPEHIEQWLEGLGQPSADRDYKPGHERLLELLSHIQQQKPRLRVRVAGTNGKGSTSFMLGRALQACGLKVGLYTSPHILSFNERIRINGTPISIDKLWQSMETLMPIALDVGASYFETATALALDQFSRAAVDVEILEAGVGARLDATTAVAADMALITPIALDHQNWLGDTLAEIAQEKAYVMAGCTHCISAPQDDAVMQILRVFNADVSVSDRREAWRGLALPGLHQRINASLAWSAVQCLAECSLANDQNGLMSIDIDLAVAHQAILQCRVPGRLQHLSIGEADVWIDAAHNNHAIEALLPSLRTLADPFDAIIVFTREDRSLKAMLPLLEQYATRLISNDDASLCDGAVVVLEQEIARKPQGNFLVLGSFITVASILAANTD